MINPVRGVVILAVIVMNESVIQPECNEGDVKALGAGNFLQYLECTNGENGNTWVTRDCDEDEFFNVDINRCYYPGIGQYENFPDPDDCTKFYSCGVQGCNHPSCRPGSGFNKDKRVCQWAHQVPDCKVLDYPYRPIVIG